MPGWRKSRTFAEACRHALDGVTYAARHERNFRIQLVIYGLVLLAAIWLKVSAAGLALIVGAATMILVLEMMNTALEVLADVVSPQYHEGLRRVKDVAAGGVLLASLGALAVGLFVFIPQLV